MIIYLAAPFFKPVQLATVFELENVIEAAGFSIISPRRSGVILKDLEPEQRREMAPIIYHKNREDIERCDIVIAVIDDFDPGTVWEMGYAAAKYKQIFTYTAKDYGLNVMLAGCSSGHARGVNEMQAILNDLKINKPPRGFAAETVT
jgi:nucleoside 2-deoxyribosyltransferase